MSKDRSIATLVAMVLFAAPVSIQAQGFIRDPFAPTETHSPAILSSPAAAARFQEIGYELAHLPNISGPEVDQAIILLTAAKSLNSQAAGVEPQLLRLATRSSAKNYSEPVIFWLQKYVGESADRVIVTDAVRYLLNRLNSREEQKALLEGVAAKIRNKNPAIDSELAMLLGLVALEQGVTEQAKFYLVQAYNSNKFNRTAFTRLVELAPGEIGPAPHLEHLRMMVRENPLDLNVALAFAVYAERLQLYEVAAQSFQYCAELFRYLYPSEPLPPHIYLPWAISCYNTVQGPAICLHIAENIRALNRFDILLEAIAGRAALRMGRQEQARQILQQAGQKAEELLLSGQGQLQISVPSSAEPVRPANARQLAWFYCFADPHPAKALDWANRAYNADSNSPSSGALLAYALSINNQMEWAKPLLGSSERSQIGDLVQARMQLSAGDKATAIQTIKAAVAKDAGSLVAERAKELLRELGSDYTPPVDARALVAFLTERLGKAVIPQFTPPDRMMDVQFSVRGTEHAYGNEIEALIAIANKGPEPLVISENSLFQGNIRISAQVAGDISRDIPNLVSETLRTSLTVPPGRSLIHTLRLSTGELRDLLINHPQASLVLQFTLYLDPVITDRGEIRNRLVDLKPVVITVRRPRVQVTNDLVRSRLSALATAPEAQKTQITRLFTGLLKEQRVMAQNALYEYQYADRLAADLRSSLVGPSGLLMGGAQSEWAVRVNAMADMLSLPLDQELAAAVAENLTHRQWPVRLMAVYLLAKGTAGSFGGVLDWVAQNDPDELVRGMATSLQSAPSFGTAPWLSTSPFAPVIQP